jgi:hypothetical protein
MSFTLTIGATTTISATKVFIPQETGNYFLRKDPFSSATYTGTHIGDGCWDFGNVEDGSYQLWNTSSLQSKFGTFQIVDNNPVFSSMNIVGNMSVTGQVNFYDSFNMNGADLAHADNIQVNTLSENTVGGGIGLSHKLVMSDALRINSGIPSLTAQNNWGIARNIFTYVSPEYSGTNSISISGLIPRYYAEANYGRLLATNSWSGTNNFAIIPTYSGTAPIISDNQLITLGKLNSAIAGIVFNASNSAYQQSSRVIRLIEGGTKQHQVVYTNYSDALSASIVSITGNASPSTSYTTIILEGNSPSNPQGIVVSDAQTGRYFYPKVTLKGISQSIKLAIPDAVMNGTSASLVENVTISHDDGGFGATPGFTNMIFKDCYFDMKVDSLTFTNCMFKAGNTINMRTGNLYLNTCSGTTYNTTVVPNETGITPPYIQSAYL